MEVIVRSRSVRLHHRVTISMSQEHLLGNGFPSRCGIPLASWTCIRTRRLGKAATWFLGLVAMPSLLRFALHRRGRHLCVSGPLSRIGKGSLTLATSRHLDMGATSRYGAQYVLVRNSGGRLTRILTVDGPASTFARGARVSARNVPRSAKSGTALCVPSFAWLDGS